MSNKTESIENLWVNFSKNRSDELKDKLLLHYIWLVKYVIQNMNLPKNTILNEDDFLNIGILGLNHSVERFEYERGVKFESYAIARIKGKIQDELRRLDWLSRSARKKAQEYLSASDELSSKYGREVSAEEIRKKLDVTHEKYRSYLEAASIAKASLSMNESSKISVLDDDDEANFMDELPDIDQENTLDSLVAKERISFLLNFLQALPEKKRLVMTLYYYEDLTFKEIGKVLEVSESRVCQIHSQVIGTLRTKLKEFDNG